MKTTLIYIQVVLLISFSACTSPSLVYKQPKQQIPASYGSALDTLNSATFKWREYFNDPFLIALIDTALKNNQELAVLELEIEMDKNEVKAKKGEYLPFVHLEGTSAVEKEGKYTWNGISEEDLKANPEKGPRYIGNQLLGAMADWEIDIWKKLRNQKKSAIMRYLATNEGRNFAKTTLISEIAEAYYELISLDNQLAVIYQNIELQKNALQLVRYEKEAAKVTQLAVNRFEAQLLNTENLQYQIKQRIVEIQNRINFLLGRIPQDVARSTGNFNNLPIDTTYSGLPAQLLQNRPDIRQAEYDLCAAKLDVKIARANFFPSFRISAGVGFNAFNPAFLFQPVSLLYNFGGELLAPLVNRSAIKASYKTANLKQTAALFRYQQCVLNAYVEVLNDLSKIENSRNSFEIKSKEVAILAESAGISANLFSSARADYIEVLLTQREALNSKMELNELKLNQLVAKVSMYRSLGGGWN